MQWLKKVLDVAKQKAEEKGDRFMKEHKEDIAMLCNLEPEEVYGFHGKNLQMVKVNVQNFIKLKKICIEVNNDNRSQRFKLLKGDVYKLFLAFRKASKMDLALDLLDGKKAQKMAQVEKLLEELNALGLSDMRTAAELQVQFDSKLADLQ